jgi:hypothetical protein
MLASLVDHIPTQIQFDRSMCAVPADTASILQYDYLVSSQLATKAGVAVFAISAYEASGNDEVRSMLTAGPN